MKNINKFFPDKVYILFLIITILLLSGCGKIQSTSSIVKHIKDKYNIDVMVITEEKDNTAKDKYARYNSVTLKEKNRDITFNAISSFSAVGMDGSTFWHQESVSDDYYENLTASIDEELSTIADKYEIKIEYYMSGLVSSVDYCGTLTNKDEQFEKINNALNEIMVAYNLKKKSQIIHHYQKF